MSDNRNNNQSPKDIPWFKNSMVWLAIVFAAIVASSLFSEASKTPANSIAYSDFRSKVIEGKVAEVVLSEDEIVGTLKDGSKFKTNSVSDSDLTGLLTQNNVKFDGKSVEKPNIWIFMLYQILPFLLILAIGIFLFRHMQRSTGAGGAMGFGKSRAKLLSEKQGRITFEDVAGIDEAREELQEIVDFLKDPRKFSRLGGQIPKGALLIGAPGTGKTLLARAIAGEAEVPFFSISGSDFVEMFVGVGASRVRDMFEQAKRSAPCIVFIDEIDAVGRHRGAGLGNGNDEREQTLNQLLVEMDGFDANEGIIIVAATNRPDVLDPALLRPGRFDRRITVPLPDIEGRHKILQVHTRKKSLAPDVDIRTIARGTPGFSGADLANLANEAALLAARLGKRLIAMAQFEAAKDRVMMGAEWKSLVMSDDEKKMTAYHEAGHALVAYHEPASDPIHKATIIPRGRALGMVVRLPERDNYSYHRDKMYANLAIAMGGRLAEEIIFGYDKVSSGAAGDIKYATDLARSMITQWGMSDELGALQYEEQQGESFLGYSQTQRHNVSNETALLIDSEIRRLVDEATVRARTILEENIDQLHKLAQTMLEYETLTGDEIDKLFKEDKLPDREESTQPKTAPIAGHVGSIPQIKRPQTSPVPA